MRLPQFPKRRPFRSYTALAFFLPLAIFTVMFFITSVTPFGDYTLLYSDNYHQYYPFFRQMREAIRTGTGLQWTWSVGGGMDYLGMISYYLASPLNFLSVLVPESLVLTYFTWLMAIKLSLASLFFAIMLKRLYGKNDLSLPLFGAFYGMCAWGLGYHWNVMWLDSFALLPLVALGTILLLRERKYLLYTISLALAVMSNYYIGLFVCIFVFLLFWCYEICRFKSVWRLLGDLLLIGVFTVLSLGLTAVLEIPTLASLQTTYSSSSTFPEGFQLNLVSSELQSAAKEAWNAYKAAKEAGEPSFRLFLSAVRAAFPAVFNGMKQVAGQIGGGQSPTYIDGMPNLYCGVFPIALGFLFLLAKDVRVRDKICGSALLLLFVLSILFRQLDYTWNGFHFTNQIPYRYSFLFSFVLLYMAYRAWLLRDSFPLWKILLAGVLSLCLLLFGAHSRSDTLYWVYNLAFLFVYILCMTVRHPQFLQFSRVLRATDDPDAPPAQADVVPDEAIADEQIVAEEVAVDDIVTEEVVTEEVIAEEVVSDSELCPSDELPAEEAAPSEELPREKFITRIFRKLIPAPVRRLWRRLFPERERKLRELLDMRDHARRRKLIAVVLTLAVLTELVLNTVLFASGFSIADWDYPKKEDYSADLFAKIDELDDGKDLFYRTEVTFTQTLNDGALNGYNGISTFSSSVNVKATEFMRLLGAGAYGSWNRYCYEQSSPVSNLFLNLKYLVDREADIITDSDGNVTVNGSLVGDTYFDTVLAENGMAVLKNNAYLPLGFLADSGLADFSAASTTSFTFQNRLFLAATGLTGADNYVWNTFSARNVEVEAGNGVTLGSGSGYSWSSFSTGTSGGTLTYRYNITRSGFMCFYADLGRQKSLSVWLNGKKLYSDSLSLAQMLAVGDVEPGDVVEVRVTCKANMSSASVLLTGAIMKEDVFRKGYDILNKSTLQLTDFDTTYLRGTIDCDRDGVLYTSIPQNGYWKAYVDGEEVETFLLCDCMLCLNLTEGEHIVELRHVNTALRLGAKITLGCAGVIALIVTTDVLLRKRRKRKAKNA